MPQADWLRPSLGIVGLVTLWRQALLVFNRTDLFVDESQYWLWGQHFAFGYYSKPPLIAWVIGLSTSIGGDTPFWVRAPFALFHGATALVLAALAARVYNGRVAVLVAASYVTLPMVAVGSLLASTDTIMAPFFAAALYFHARLVQAGTARFALLTGAMAGMAFLAKYAGVYFLLGAGLGALLLPALRIGWRNGAWMLLAFVAVAAPNLLWNLWNGFTTLSHTVDNVGWMREATPINPAGLAEFFFSQFAVAGPVVFGAILWALRHPMRTDTARLLVFVVPAIAIVCAQALLDQAYANWAASAYFAGTVVAAATLAPYGRVLTASFVINGCITLALPLLAVMPHLTLGRDAPLLARYQGQSQLSHALIAAAQRAGNVPIVSDRREVLADLFFTGATSGLAFYAVPPQGRPMNHYQQAWPLPATSAGPVLLVTRNVPQCPAERVDLPTDLPAYAKSRLAAYLIPAECVTHD